jgi:3-hydroxybutyryl-CoA dehydrogenase
MGGGIAISAITHGFHCTLIDTTEAALERVRARIEKYLNRQLEKQRMTEVQVTEVLNNLTTSIDMTAAEEAQLVIEAVFEDIEVKHKVFLALEAIVSANTTLATNTSALKVSDIGANLKYPERLCGIHYFSPAEINPVVEVIKSETTSTKTVGQVLPFLASCHKIAIECKDSKGFALNRFFCPYTNEAARCIDDGLGTPAQIDEVAKEVLGVTVGPFFVMNIIKTRINLAAVRNLAALGDFYAPALSLSALGDADKTWDMSVSEELLNEANYKVISDRMQGAIFYAVLEELRENVTSSEAIDQGACKAFTFAKGPAAMMRDLGKYEVQRMLDCVHPYSKELIHNFFETP